MNNEIIEMSKGIMESFRLNIPNSKYQATEVLLIHGFGITACNSEI